MISLDFIAKSPEEKCVPASPGLRRRDAETNIRIADDPEGKRMISRGMTTMS